jgi:hypothetical protein
VTVRVELLDKLGTDESGSTYDDDLHGTHLSAWVGAGFALLTGPLAAL